ncbi:MAG: pentapeptide repeat-containing protein [Hyphomicrobiales bacterium]|nr:pentapeptide repeat-containing protein [Hyphomicrobiales bacterium]
MGDPSHIAKVQEGVDQWNAWRKANPRLQPDLTHVDLSGRDLSGIDFRGVGLFEADLSHARLIGANLRQARLVRTRLDNADLTGAKVWGASVWDVSLAGSVQADLLITPRGAEVVTVDDLEVAQFIYLLINNRNLRRVIDTITSKVVLILGRFTPGRKAVLDLLKHELRKRGYVPVLFDFQGPESLDLTETVATLARLSRFVVADLTDPSCIPHELLTIVPDVQVPVVTLIGRGHAPYAMFADLVRKYWWLHAPLEYTDAGEIQDGVLPQVITNAEETRKKILS